jgi:predicted RNA polymerase sigma factor
MYERFMKLGLKIKADVVAAQIQRVKLPLMMVELALFLPAHFDVAEEIVQDALLIALEHWSVDGIPERPGVWLLTVARRRALNQLSRDARYREKLAQLEQPEAVLSEVNALAGELDHYHLFHAIRGELLLELSEREQARACALRALDLTQNRAEQSLLSRRLLEW